MQINIIATFVAVLIFGAGLIERAHTQDCPRGDLDKGYCDRDGDFVADAPTDPKRLVNPSTLIFAYTPVEDPASSPVRLCHPRRPALRAETTKSATVKTTATAGME